MAGLQSRSIVVLLPIEFLPRFGVPTSALHCVHFVKAGLLSVGFVAGYTPARLHLGSEVEALRRRRSAAEGPCTLAASVSLSCLEYVHGRKVTEEVYLYLYVYTIVSTFSRGPSSSRLISALSVLGQRVRGRAYTDRLWYFCFA